MLSNLLLYNSKYNRVVKQYTIELSTQCSYDIEVVSCQGVLVGINLVCHNMYMARHTPSNVNEKRVAKEHIPDPRQALVIAFYKDPSSYTFANLKQSMIRAGYSEKYADKHYSQSIKWIEQIKGTVEMIQKAERNIDKAVSMPINVQEPSKSDIELYKIQQGASQFVLKTLARQKYNDAQDKQDNAQINVNIIKQYNITNTLSSEPYPDAIDV